MITGIVGLLIAIMGLAASVIALFAEDLNRRPLLKAITGFVLGGLILYVAYASVYDLANSGQPDTLAAVVATAQIEAQQTAQASLPATSVVTVTQLVVATPTVTLPDTSIIGIEQILATAYAYTASDDTISIKDATVTATLTRDNYASVLKVTDDGDAKVDYQLEYKVPEDQIYHSSRLSFDIKDTAQDISDFEILEISAIFTSGSSRGTLCIASGANFPCMCFDGTCTYPDDVVISRVGNQQTFRIPLSKAFKSFDKQTVRRFDFVMSNWRGSASGTLTITGIRLLKQ